MQKLGLNQTILQPNCNTKIYTKLNTEKTNSNERKPGLGVFYTPSGQETDRTDSPAPVARMGLQDEEDDHTWPDMCGILLKNEASTNNLNEKGHPSTIYWGIAPN